MANKKALFGILDNGDGTGAGITKVDPGTTLESAVDCTIAAPAFQNSSGVLVFPALDSEGKIPVTTDAAGICHDAYAKVTGTTSFQDLGSYTAALTKTYTRIAWSVASSTEACFELVYVDDAAGTPTETVLACAVTGPGQYSFCCTLDCIEIDTTGGTGTQVLKITGKLLESTGSELCGTISLKEVS